MQLRLPLPLALPRPLLHQAAQMPPLQTGNIVEQKMREMVAAHLSQETVVAEGGNHHRTRTVMGVVVVGPEWRRITKGPLLMHKTGEGVKGTLLTISRATSNHSTRM